MFGIEICDPNFLNMKMYSASQIKLLTYEATYFMSLKFEVLYLPCSSMYLQVMGLIWKLIFWETQDLKLD